MITETTITKTIHKETYCRPMYWAVVSIMSDRPNDEYVMAQFHTETDARFFVDSLPPQNLEVRKIVSHD